MYVLLSRSQAGPGRNFSQPRTNHFFLSALTGNCSDIWGIILSEQLAAVLVAKTLPLSLGSLLEGQNSKDKIAHPPPLSASALRCQSEVRLGEGGIMADLRASLEGFLGFVDVEFTQRDPEKGDSRNLQPAKSVEFIRFLRFTEISFRGS